MKKTGNKEFFTWKNWQSKTRKIKTCSWK